MKKKLIILSVLLFCASLCFSQSFECSRFKEGKFRIADTRAGVVTIAERKGGYQTESSETLKAIVRFKITWQDNCSYTLKLDKVIRNENKINFPYDLEIKVKITQTTDSGYTQETTSSLTTGTYNVVVTKIN